MLRLVRSGVEFAYGSGWSSDPGRLGVGARRVCVVRRNQVPHFGKLGSHALVSHGRTRTRP